MRDTNNEQPACVTDCRRCGAETRSRRRFLQSGGFLSLTALLVGLSSKVSGGLLAAPEQSSAERRYPIPSGDSVNIDRASQLIVVRATGHMYVFALSCPHQNNAVKWVAKDHRFQCTKHDSQYQVDGVHTSGRATRNLDRYLIRRDGDSVVVDLHKWVQSDKDANAWAAAAIAV